MKTFEGLNISSKFAICGLPIRLDSYKTCSFGCRYCFSNNRKIMEFKKELQVANIQSIERRLDRLASVQKSMGGGIFRYNDFKRNHMALWRYE